MKISSKISTFLHISVLCCFIVISYNSNLLTSIMTSPAGKSILNENYSSIISANLFLPTGETDNVIHGYNINTPSSLKTNPNDFLACIKAKELLLVNLFSKYIFFSRNVVIRFQPTDIIFPFHYFW